MGARGTLCGRPVGQIRAPDICKEARQARMGSGAGMGCEGPMHKKAPSAVRPASLGSKARRLCMGGSRTRRRGRHETCGSWHAGGTCPSGSGSRRGLSRSAETSLNNYYSPTCAHPVERPFHACPRPAPACIVLPRAAPQSMRPREPREPDTAEDAGGQTDHLGQAYRGGLRKKRFYLEPPSFMNSLNPFVFSTLKSFLDGEFDPGSGRTLAARLTHASRAVKAPSGVNKAANGRVTRGQPAPLPGIAGGNPG